MAPKRGLQKSDVARTQKELSGQSSHQLYHSIGDNNSTAVIGIGDEDAESRAFVFGVGVRVNKAGLRNYSGL